MTVTWVTAFLDYPRALVDSGIAFWATALGATVSQPRGEDGQFVSLVPASGDPYVRIQRLGPRHRVHLDLHVSDVAQAVALAEEQGASIVSQAGHVVLESPGGFEFCVVADGGERVVPPPSDGGFGAASRLDQVTLEVPGPAYARESAFWSAITGWAAQRFGPLGEIAFAPPGLPLRVVLERVPGPRVIAHVDVACGAGRAVVARQHQALGANIVATNPRWTRLRGPGGLVYWLTDRDPVSGLPVAGW